MASNSLESSRGGGARTEEGKPSENGNGKATDLKVEAPKSGGGIKPWLPLIAVAVAMPALAFATTQFILLPKLQRAIGDAKPAATAEAAAPAAPSAGGGEGKAISEKAKSTYSLSKMLVNVAGTMGTRYLMTSVTLVGSTSDFKDKIDENKDQLTDLATGTLSSKTISDLEKPGARNLIRTELMTVFNNALGGPVVQDIYITELAIQ